jgi:hypothetical protein
MFHRCVTSVSDGCCICCNGCTLMLQRSVTNVSSVFWDVCCKCVYLDIAYVSHIVFYLDVAYVCNDFQVFSGGFFIKYFRSMFQVFHLSSFLCCKCCI